MKFEGLESVDQVIFGIIANSARISSQRRRREEENSKAERVDRHVHATAIDEWELTEVPRHCQDQKASD